MQLEKSNTLQKCYQGDSLMICQHIFLYSRRISQFLITIYVDKSGKNLEINNENIAPNSVKFEKNSRISPFSAKIFIAGAEYASIIALGYIFF